MGIRATITHAGIVLYRERAFGADDDVENRRDSKRLHFLMIAYILCQPQYGTVPKSDESSHARNAPSAQPSMSPTMVMIAMNRRDCTATGFWCRYECRSDKIRSALRRYGR